MKTLFAILSIAICLLTAPGCVSPEVTAYRSIGTVTVSVDAAMNGWGDYVRAGKATDAQQETVAELYARYQQAMTICAKTVLAIKSAPAGQQEWITAVNVASAAGSDLVSLIQTFKKGKL